MEEKLFYTIESGDYRTLKHLIHQGVSANTIFYGADPITKSHWSALHLCCEKGRYECAKVLLEGRAYPDTQDKWNQTPLMYSVCGEWPDLTQLLIDSGSDVNCQDKKGRTAAHVAVNCSDNSCLQLLITGGIDVNLADNEGSTPLRLAVTEDGNLDKVTSLLTAGSDVNQADFRDDKTPLQAVLSCRTFYHRKSYVRLLLDYKAETNRTDRLGLTTFMSLLSRYRGRNWDQYPIALAELLQEKELMTWLVEAGCDINTATSQWGMALHVAIDVCPAYVEHLLQLGADSNVHSRLTSSIRNGNTSRSKSPLFVATRKQDLDTAKLLITHNCHLDKHNSPDSMSPLCAALDNSDAAMAHLLLNAGYDITSDKEARDFLFSDVIPDLNRKGMSLTEKDCQFFRDLSSAPQSLLIVCRNYIRRIMGRDLTENVCKLPLPAAIKSDILLEKVTKR